MCGLLISLMIYLVAYKKHHMGVLTRLKTLFSMEGVLDNTVTPQSDSEVSGRQAK